MEINNIIYGLVKAPLANSLRSHVSARKNIVRAAIKQPCYITTRQHETLELDIRMNKISWHEPPQETRELFQL